MITSDDFAPGIEALLASITSSQPSSSAGRPVLVMVTSGVSSRVRDKIKKGGGKLVEVESMGVPEQRAVDAGAAGTTQAKQATPSTAVTHVTSWVDTGYTKLGLWGFGTKEMGAWEAVVYVDADAIVLEDLSPVFARVSTACPLVAAPDVFPPDRFNAGVLGVALDDDGSTLADMKTKLLELGTYDGGDTGFLNNYFSNWFQRPESARLPFRYNAQRTMHWLTHDKQPGYWECCKPIAVLHFSSNPKPWQVPDKKGELELIWWQYFMQAQLQASLGVDFASALSGF